MQVPARPALRISRASPSTANISGSTCAGSGRPAGLSTSPPTDTATRWFRSPEAYDALSDKAELAESLALLERSVEDIERGRTQLAKPALNRIANELGLNLER